MTKGSYQVGLKLQPIDFSEALEMRRPETAVKQYRAIGLSLYAKELAPRQRREKNHQLATIQTIYNKLCVVNCFYPMKQRLLLHYMQTLAH